MSRLRHGLGGALSAFRDAPLVHLVAVLTVGVSLFLAVSLGGLLLGAQNALRSWGAQVELTLYLAPSLDDEEGLRVAEQAVEVAGGTSRYVSPEEAWDRLARALGESGHFLERLPDNPLPPSVELLPPPPYELARMERLAGSLQRLPGVEEVDWGREWGLRLAALSRLLRGLSWVLLPLLGLGAAALVGAVVRLAVLLRREEIELLRLLGATDAFIRLPFVLEGGLAGLGGGVLAAGALGFLGRWGADLLTLLPAGLGWERLASPWALLGVAGVGALLGMVASHLSVGRQLR